MRSISRSRTAFQTRSPRARRGDRRRSGHGALLHAGLFRHAAGRRNRNPARQRQPAGRPHAGRRRRYQPLPRRTQRTYGPADGVTHTLNLHAQPAGLLNVMIEIRNDLIETEIGQGVAADFLSGLLRESLQQKYDKRPRGETVVGVPVASGFGMELQAARVACFKNRGTSCLTIQKVIRSRTYIFCIPWGMPRSWSGA